MKKLIPLIFIALFCNNNLKLYAQKVIPETPKKRSQYISYTVPINLNTNTNNLDNITGVKNDFNSDELEQLSFVRLSQQKRREFVKTIINKIKSGKITVYDVGINDGVEIVPELQFMYPINTEDIDKYLGYELSFYKRYNSNHPDVTSGMANVGDILIDENGNEVVFDTIIPYKIDDISSITFLENWTLNTRTNILEKNIVGYKINTPYYSPETDNYIGEKGLFWIHCIDKKIKNKNLMKLANNIETNTQIINTQGWEDFNFNNLNNDDKKPSIRQWNLLHMISDYNYQNYLPGDFRFYFISPSEFAPLMSSNNNLPIYETSKGFSSTKEFPYSKILNNEEVYLSSGLLHIFKKRYSLNHPDVISGLASPGEVMKDENDMDIQSDTLVLYSPKDIVKIGFVEDWYFDKENLTIKKNINGIIPMVLAINPVTNQVIGFKKLYCIRYQD